MYPRNAVSPERIAVGSVIQISDGAVQSAGVSILIRPQGSGESAGTGTIEYGSNGTVYYTPVQAETNYTSFVIEASKTGCVPVSVTVVTTASPTAGKASVESIDNSAINSNTLADGAITAPKIASNALTNAKFADDAFTNRLIATDMLTADSVAADFIGATEIASSASQEIADLIASDWIASDASPLAFVAALKADVEWSNLVTLASAVDANADVLDLLKRLSLGSGKEDVSINTRTSQTEYTLSNGPSHDFVGGVALLRDADQSNAPSMVNIESYTAIGQSLVLRDSPSFTTAIADGLDLAGVPAPPKIGEADIEDGAFTPSKFSAEIDVNVTKIANQDATASQEVKFDVIEAVLAGRVNVTPEGNGTFTLAFRNRADDATLLTVNYDPATGARTIT